MQKYIQITTTTDKKADAEKISKKLVEMRLAACVQVVGPIRSIYWWKDVIESNEEWLCIIKTENELYKEIEKVLSEIHPYEVPEIVSVPIVNGSHAYLSWLYEELRK